MNRIKYDPIYPRYLKYKDGGIDWIGEIPEVWDRRKIDQGAYFHCRRKIGIKH